VVGDHRGVEPQEAGRVVLDLNPGEPISGHIQGAGGTAEAFRGWVELAGKIERLRSSIAATDPAGSESNTTQGA
jgi:hypothetical protein